jgi:hypothetical protein
MHDSLSPNHPAAKGCGDGLMSQTNTKHRDFRSKMTNGLYGDTGLVWSAGTG